MEVRTSHNLKFWIQIVFMNTVGFPLQNIVGGGEGRKFRRRFPNQYGFSSSPHRVDYLTPSRMCAYALCGRIGKMYPHAH